MRTVSWAVGALISATIIACSEKTTPTVYGSDGPPPQFPTNAVAKVEVSPPTARILVGAKAQFASVAKDASGNALNNVAIEWKSADSLVARVTADGMVTAVAPGTAAITATSEGVTGTATVTSALAPVASVEVTPANSTVGTGGTIQLYVTPKDAAGNILSGRTVSWSSSNTAVATVSPSGIVSAVAAGSTTITVLSEGISGSATVNVTATPAPPPAPVATITVTLASPILMMGQGTQATATLRDGTGNVLTGRTITWASSNTGAATVSTAGYVTAVAPGQVSITATSEGISASASLTVNAPPVATVTVTPHNPSITAGLTLQLVAVTKDASGTTLSGRTITWSSSNSGVATVSASGLVTALAAGTATITATSEGISGTTDVTVTAPAPVPVATVTVTPASASLILGATLQLAAVTKDAGGNTLSGRSISWSSSNTSVANVSSAGLVTAVAAGSATVTATSEGKQGTSSLTITASNPNGGCTNGQPGWIWCDDFEQDRTAQYFEYDNAGGNFVRASGTGRNGGTAMRAHYSAGAVSVGSLKLALGQTPSSTFKPVDAGTANYRELYWRVYFRNQYGWTGGGGGKLTRATVFTAPDWSQAMIAHLWSSDPPDETHLQLDPARGTDASGNVLTVGYNDFAHLTWLGAQRSTTAFFDAAHVGKWYCVELHVKLNDPGQSNGIYELRVDGNLEASRTGLNFLGSYSTYGINAVFLENYWNQGSPVAQDRYLDDFVVSQQPIGCTPTTQPPPPVPVASVSVALGTSSIVAGGTTAATATLRDASGNVLTGRNVAWSNTPSTGASISSDGTVTALAAGAETITATSEGVSGSAALIIAPPPPPPSGSSTCPNEPAGLTMVSDQPWNAVPPNLNAVDAAGWGVDRNPENLTIVSDPTAPRSASNVVHGIFPAGGAGGTAPFRVERPFATQSYGTIFECVWLMHSPNFTDNGNIGTKVSFYRGSGQNHYWGFESASGKDQFYFLVELQGGGGDRTIRTSVTQGPGTAVFQALPTGVWRRYEVLVSANTPGTANGILKVWADGVLIINLSDVAWWGAGQTPSWTGIAWEPVYGGGLNPIPVTMFQAFDHWYVSGK
jgi:uncharacterized protein YjdB